MTGTGKTKSADMQAEYDYAVKQGQALIDKALPAELSKKSIEEIHYWYNYAANILIQRGDVPKHKIVGKLYEDFNQFYGVQHIYRILKAGGIEVPNAEESSHMLKNDSSLNTVYEQENARYIPYVESVKQFCISFLNTLRTSHFEKAIIRKAEEEYAEALAKSIDKAHPQGDKNNPAVKAKFAALEEAKVQQEAFDRELREFFIFAPALVKNANDAADGRREYRVNTLHVLVAKALATTVNEADYHYGLWIKPFIASVAKQTRKIIKGWTPELPAIMEPNDRDNAVYWEFSGTPCPECIKAKRNPWRTKKQWSTDNPASLKYVIECQQCDYVSEPIDAVLYKEKSNEMPPRFADSPANTAQYADWKRRNEIDTSAKPTSA